jgi:hypothetical protein
MKYLLTVFVSHKRQEDFVVSLAKEVQTLSKTGVKYFFGEQTILITFETQASFQQTTDFFGAILGDLSIPFVLSPTAKIAYWFNKENEKHLFGTDLCNTNDEYSDEEQKNLIDDLFLDHDDKPQKPFNDGIWSSASIRRNLDDSAEHLFGKNKKTEEIPTLNELLDKINVSGMKSLTDEEKELLNKYSK